MSLFIRFKNEFAGENHGTMENHRQIRNFVGDNILKIKIYSQKIELMNFDKLKIKE